MSALGLVLVAHHQGLGGSLGEAAVAGSGDLLLAIVRGGLVGSGEWALLPLLGVAPDEVVDALLPVHQVLLWLPGRVLPAVAFSPNQILQLLFLVLPLVSDPFNLIELRGGHGMLCCAGPARPP